jgi:hypothetical protein
MTQFDDIIVTPVYGPLNTGRTPCTLPFMNLGVLSGIRPNPPQFYPASGCSDFSNARAEFFRVATRTNNQYGIIAKSGGSCGYNKNLESYPGVIPQYGKSNKYIAPQCSSLFTSARKRNAVGKSSFKEGLPSNADLSYKNYNRNDVKTALRITRAGGCTAPAKKGSIFNSSPGAKGSGSYLASSSIN